MKKILLVEDEQSLREGICDVLTFEVRERQRTGGSISSLIAQQEDQARTVSAKLCKSQ